MSEIKNIIEKYCPVMKSNMPIQVHYDKQGSCSESCLCKNRCTENQKCRYNVFDLGDRTM